MTLTVGQLMPDIALFCPACGFDTKIRLLANLFAEIFVLVMTDGWTLNTDTKTSPASGVVAEI